MFALLGVETKKKDTRGDFLKFFNSMGLCADKYLISDMEGKRVEKGRLVLE